MSDSIFGSPGGGQTSLQELEAVTKEFPDLSGGIPEPDKDLSGPSDSAPEKPVEAQPPAADAKPPAPADPAQKPPEAADDKQGGKTVPLSELQQERARRRELETKLAEFQGQLAAVTQMVRPQQPAPQAQPQQPEDPQPDPNEDPMAFMAWQGREIGRQNERMQAMTRYLQGQAAEQHITQAYTADAAAFTQRQADFPQAYNHLFTQRVAQLRAMGYADDAIRQQVRREEQGIVTSALRNGQSPAAVAYEMAKTYGYRTPEAAPPAALPVVPPAAPPPVDPALAEAKARAAQGHKEGGATPEAELSLEDIAKLNGAAFESAMKKYESRNVKRPGGGMFRQ